MKKILAVILIFILALSMLSLSSCAEEHDDVKSLHGFLDFVFGEETSATKFFEEFVPFATTRAALDCIFDVYGNAKNAVNGIVGKVEAFYAGRGGSAADIIGAVLLTLPMIPLIAGSLAIILLYFALSLTVVLLFFVFAIVYDMVLVSMYGWSLGFGILFRTVAYLFIDLGFGKLLVQKTFSPLFFFAGLFTNMF